MTWLLGVAGSELRLCANDCEMAISREDVGTQTRNAAGGLRRDWIASKRLYKVVYSWLPGPTRFTGDGGMGRDALLALMEAGGALSLHVPTDDEVDEDVTVMFDLGSWSENLLWDGPVGKVWAVSFTLIEV